ncbi:hypothetical protein EG328_003743 [Venturia inaequalis]|uniref:Uncharacterized protein n=2 Tax=Venturia inaequalis TaxID=5025 RepID=A0A8H3UPZ6_VENIN|nr:hypothetical protein EG328_003743 [Venturia inaequalis]
MAYPNTDRICALTHQLLDAVTKHYPSHYQSCDSTSPSFHNFPWLPTPPMISLHLEPVEMPGSEPAFELPGSWPKSSTPDPSESNKNIYAEVWLTENPPPYSIFPLSRTPSATSISSDESSSTMYSAKSHFSQSSQTSQTSMNPQPARTTRSLKRKQAPQNITLRQLRAKESEAELRKMYEQQTDEYLEELFAMLGSPIPRPLSSIRE